MTYRLNGHPLDDTRFGWSVRSTSKPLVELSQSLSTVNRRGKHGAASPVHGTLEVPTLLLVINTPREHRRTLQALVRSGGILTSSYDPGEVEVEFVSATPTGYGNADAFIDLAVIFRAPTALARADLVTSKVVAITSATTVAPGLFPGLSAEVQDAVVRVKGACTGLQVTDSSGAWFTFDAVAANEYLRFHADTGRAYITGGDIWAGGVEVSGRVDFGGPRGVFEIAPAWSANPAERAGALTIATASRSSASVQVRGRAAYLI